MSDLLQLGLMVGFACLSYGYILVAERLGTSSESQSGRSSDDTEEGSYGAF